MPGFLSIEYATLTDVGVRRPHNEDTHAALPAGDAAQWQQRGHLFIVADGMGGHAVGELASKVAVDNIPHIYFKHAQDGAAAGLRKAFLETNTVIHTRGQQNLDFKGMGTTGTVLLLAPDGAWIGHVGDSRAYRVRAGRIEQLSFDHSELWELARIRGVKPEQLQGIPSNRITRSLGPEPNVQVDIEGPHVVKAGDVYVVCSDGLSGQVSDREIGAAVSALCPKDACRFLVDLANLQGGPDNITVAVICVLGMDDGAMPGGDPPLAAKAAGLPWKVGSAWPLASLLIGIVLALAAIALTRATFAGGTLVFFLAAGAIGAGLVGLFLQSRSESKADVDTAPTRPRIHRQTACVIDLPLVKHLARAETLLGERIRERQWSADWDDVQQHHALAEQNLNAGKLADAFREYCLAMRPLSEAVQRQRQREDAFQPVWDEEAFSD